MLHLQHLSLGYQGRQVFGCDSLSFHRGERVAIVGASGAGKSTLLGHIHQQLAAEAALCAQAQGLVDGLSVFHNVYMGALARHHWSYNLLNLAWPLAGHKSAIRALCDELELDCPLTTAVGRLSGGQRQRVALARALYQNKDIFIGDEPLSALDPLMAQRLLSRIQARHHSTIMVLHNKQQALNYFDRIIGIAEGRVILDSPTANLDASALDSFYLDTAADATS
ncbi:ATP-binding cassette domain-containing protein [Shewanella sedimentimangrovi]|uniref:ATP-binding cassette domain-containing protein n=1 Tax=Shewanella sedimentimangrovi TaxID=2814293 RepID=A0ABX7QZ25_9GAMM|nr:ATP-binding cassette domain-containing protein [Shewanella sedimentimangrovi]QSX35858.1 ATP-binding cassette domain-containing protein [Shewanella sedimentimangrovi]